MHCSLFVSLVSRIGLVVVVVVVVVIVVVVVVVVVVKGNQIDFPKTATKDSLGAVDHSQNGSWVMRGIHEVNFPC